MPAAPDVDSGDLPSAYRTLAARLADPAGLTVGAQRRRPTGPARSAVLVLLNRFGEPDIVFTERNRSLRSHAGQISFPGGRRDEGDADLCQTALREAWEEIGLPPERVEVIGTLPVALLPASGMNVTPVIGLWSGRDEIWPHSPVEVESVHRWKIAALAAPDNRISYRHPLGFTGPAWQFGEQFLWGFTAYLVDEILKLGGWAQPWDASREVTVPKRYLGKH